MRWLQPSASNSDANIPVKVTLSNYLCRCNFTVKDGSSPDYARWLPISRNQLKNMGLSGIRHVLVFAVTNNLMH